jgi:60S ribosome subunit biogenesis protein NIP7
MTYRNLTRQEKTLVKRALGRWGAYQALADKTFIIQDNNGEHKIVCILSPDLEFITIGAQPSLAGLAIGQLEKQFTPSMAGADIFARLGRKNKYYVTVNENAEKLVLYGRDVMGESIVSASAELDENELVIILNKREEAMGIGRTKFGGKKILQRGKVTIATLADAGYYLRDEG